ncbi:MAG: LptF/LptG family permease [Rickettsiaceae bacterium]|nr:LptF/LptG family permease [Rickettsiaceae bacterium]
MFLNNTLFLYITNLYLRSLMFVLLGISLCVTCFNMFDVMNKARSFILPVYEIFILSILKLPLVLHELLPVSILISSLYFFQTISKRNEAVIIFTSGISVWRFLQPLVFVSILVGIFFVTIIQPISAFCLDIQTSLERKYFSPKKANMISVIDTGLYIFESFDSGNRIITARIIIRDKSTIKGVTILELDNDNNPINRIESDEARFLDSGIILGSKSFGVTMTGDKIDMANQILKTNLSFSTIIKKFESPENIPFWKLGRLATELNNSGIHADKFVNYYYKLFFRPIYCASIILLSCCFLNINPRGRSRIKLLGYGSILGFVTHSSKEVGSALLISKEFSPFFAQSMPIILIAMVSILVIIQLFEIK